MGGKRHFVAIAASTILLAMPATAGEHGHHGASGQHHGPVADSIIAAQREALAHNTAGKGFGPQSPRDIDNIAGENGRIFGTAPTYTRMNLCNIHFHKNAEHKAKEFSIHAGNGDGHGYQSGYRYDTSRLTKAELAPTKHKICDSAHSTLRPGDTIEVHYVHTTSQVKPGPTLKSCLSEAIKNPQLRVETQVFVLVNDRNAADFRALTHYEKSAYGYYQATAIPSDTGTPVEYAGSTTGPGYNENGSPFQVTWSVRPHVTKVDIESVGAWCEGNDFNEDHAHGVRNLVKNKALLSQIH